MLFSTSPKVRTCNLIRITVSSGGLYCGGSLSESINPHFLIICVFIGIC